MYIQIYRDIDLDLELDTDVFPQVLTDTDKPSLAKIHTNPRKNRAVATFWNDMIPRKRQ